MNITRNFTAYSNPFNNSATLRELVVVNLTTRRIVETRMDNTQQIGQGCARITKRIYDMMCDGNHIAYYAHNPSDIRVPAIIGGRYYAKPSNWKPKA